MKILNFNKKTFKIGENKIVFWYRISYGINKLAVKVVVQKRIFFYSCHEHWCYSLWRM